MSVHTKLLFIIADKSYLIRSGIRKILEDYRPDAEIRETETMIGLKQALRSTAPDVLLCNVKIFGKTSGNIRKDLNININSKLIAIVGSMRCNEKISFFDEQICIDEDKATITETLNKIVETLPERTDTPDTSDLTERERDVLREVALGKSNKEIADYLNISTHTVISHRKNISNKLGIKTASGLTVYAILNNIITLN